MSGRPPDPKKKAMLDLAEKHGFDFGRGFKCKISSRQLSILFRLLRRMDLAMAALKAAQGVLECERLACRVRGMALEDCITELEEGR